MTIQALIDFAAERGGLATDDVLASLLPLFRQVAGCHEAGFVAPLRGIDSLVADDRRQVSFDPALAQQPGRADGAIAAAERVEPIAVELTSAGEPAAEPDRAPDARVRPALVPGWETWEHRLGHHDELTDIASLGELVAALAAGLDLGRVDNLERLAAHRANLFALAPDLHPVVAQLASRMLEPDRRRRAQDLRSIIERLETYRDQPLDLDLERVAVGGGPDERRRAILTVLRDRLFDLSRRNRLIWFRPTQQSLNLTDASVPLLLDPRNIRPEQLFTWPVAAPRVLGRERISVGGIIRWEDAPYASAILDTVISGARRDRAEYGRSELRLIVAFLRWHDLKGELEQRIDSPLLLLPVTLTRKRGVRDSYMLEAESTEAEVNPALRQILRQLYGLELPESVDLAEERIEDLHARLVTAIGATEPAVELRLRDRPLVEVVQRRALDRRDAFQRRAGRAAVAVGPRSYSYSYRRADFRPLGIQIFRDRVAARPSPLGLALAESAAAAAEPAVATLVAPGVEPASANPYAWELDLTALTVANVNSRTLSLVRDYGELLATGSTSDAFDRIFALEPKPLDGDAVEDLPFEDRYLVIPADGSQVRALARARSGGSLVIQGPPGTGKSQTITNLAADYVARGQRVLFVCQKRAALDVVYARLRQRGLDELATLIHDSQADKKAFVQGLRATYESWLADPGGAAREELVRAGILADLEAAIDEVGRYEEALSTTAGAGGPTLRTLVERLVELRGARPEVDLTPAERALLPLPAAWWAARSVLGRIETAIAVTSGSAVLASNAVVHLADAVLAAARPDAEAAVVADAATEALGSVLAALERVGQADPAAASPASVARAGALGAILLPLAQRGQSTVLDRSSLAAGSLARQVKDWQAGQRTLADRAAAASGWQAPLAPEDARAALAVAQAHEGSLLRFLHGDWRRVRAAVKRGFVDPGVAVRMTTSEALTRLVAWQEAQAAVDAAAQSSEAVWGDRDPTAVAERIEDIRRSTEPEVVAWRDRLATAPDAGLATALVEAGASLDAARPAVARALAGVEDGSIVEVLAMLASISDPRAASTIRALAPALAELVRDHPAVAAAVRALPFHPDTLEYEIARAALDEADVGDPRLARFDGARFADSVANIQALLPRLFAADAAVVVARVRARFADGIAHAATSATGMSAEDRERKKSWTAARRDLENEFRKVMRYRSIRDLASGETGEVVAALRPIWLMSPTSVSDTMPLDAAAFDLVVYDEASQIPIEEAVPAMHRAHQLVVVGDRMQLPPSTFFTVRSEIADDPDDEVELGVVLDGDSFLSQCAGRLPSTMLTWHYRSRHESLIAFSNTAFYDGRLATIPDRRPPSGPLPEIRVEAGADDVAYSGAIRAGVDGLLARPISFHRLDRSPYVLRTNPGEAAYIAGLVADLLRRDTGLTLGVVAFSEAQQTEIEGALETLARHDPEFAERYEAELVREDDDQFVGLFVKNLENVQGDERDVIVMSVCYGPDDTGRMIMNFGPINQDGGEKRLNVIFSRARRHMAVVSSIGPEAITNVYNDGANTLRAFLGYASAMSRGDGAAASALLRSFGERGRRSTDVPVADGPVIGQLGAALRERGIEAVERLGQSHFRCDVALRRPGDSAYRVAVLVDHRERVGAQPLVERLVSHPLVLAGAGWRVAHVLTKDWFERPDEVLAGLERELDAAAAAERPDRQAIDATVSAAARMTPPPPVASAM